MKNTRKVYIGIDVAKASLDVSTPSESFSVPNNKEGFLKLYKSIKRSGDELHCVCEATGGYELNMALFLSKKGIPVSVENPAKLKFFARSLGERAKTDKLDSAFLRTYGEKMNPEIWTPPTQEQMEVRALFRRREEYIKIRSQEKNRLAIESVKQIQKMIEKHIKYLNNAIKELESEIEKRAQLDAELTRKIDAIKDIDGCGKVAAMSLIAFLPELGTLTKGGIAALVGLAPYNRDSGQKTGKRFIRGGRKELRDKMYMPTMRAMEHNDVIRNFRNVC